MSAVLARACAHRVFGRAIADWRERLRARSARRIAIALDNGPDWMAVDLAALAEQCVVAPIAPFFSPAQRRHAIDSAGCDILLTDALFEADDPGLVDGFRAVETCAGIRIWQRQPAAVPELAPGTFKISYTSGTTGNPKGACLSADLLEAVAGALTQRTASLDIGRHLCLLPLAVLLENVAGAWAALLSNAELILPPLAETGLTGSSGLDPAAFVDCIHRHRPHSIIVLPELLKAMCGLVAAGMLDPSGQKLVAVGGARTPPSLIEQARALALPVYEGYGLTECGSVVCLNAPGADRPGSVGRALDHQRLSCTPRGELRIHGPRFLGYVGDPARPDDAPLATGDFGAIDADGFVHVHGRRDNVYATSWGRNIAPEWIEAELNAQPEIAQSFVHGRGLPANRAVLVATGASVDAVQAAVDRVNRQLPDYARIGHWYLRRQPFGPADGTATANGRPRRPAILAAHRANLIGPNAPEPAGHDRRVATDPDRCGMPPA